MLWPVWCGSVFISVFDVYVKAPYFRQVWAIIVIQLAFSIANSLTAHVTISPILSWKRCNSMAKIFWSVNVSGLISNFWPVFSISSFQCLVNHATHFHALWKNWFSTKNICKWMKALIPPYCMPTKKWYAEITWKQRCKKLRYTLWMEKNKIFFFITSTKLHFYHLWRFAFPLNLTPNWVNNSLAPNSVSTSPTET